MSRRKHVKHKSNLHPESLKFLELQNALASTDGNAETPEQARRGLEEGIPSCNGTVEFDGNVLDLHIPASSSAGVPATVYIPSGCHGNPAILVYFHGGGMVIGSRESVDATCKTIAMESPCIVVSVGYRLAPEHKFPASFEDAETAVKWVLKNKSVVGGSISSKVGVGGDSAGGTLAATVCHDVSELAFQILVYPRVEYMGKTERLSAKEYEDGPILSKDVVSWYRGHFLRSPADKNDVLLNPYLRPGFDRLPPALLVVAECDPLRDDSYDYQKKLREVGVTADLLQVDGACHSFFTKPGVFKECCAVAYGRVTEFIRKFNTDDKGC